MRHNVLPLLAAAALPWYAFVQGHPFRVRYMVPLVAAGCVMAGFVVAVLPARLRAVGAALLLTIAVVQRAPLDPRRSNPLGS